LTVAEFDYFACVIYSKQPDLGTACWVAFSGVFVLFLAGLDGPLYFGCCGVAPIAGYAFYAILCMITTPTRINFFESRK